MVRGIFAITNILDAKAGTVAHGDRDGWPDMPPEDVPSLEKYLAEHTVDDIITRIKTGLKAQMEIILDPYGRVNFLLVLTIVAGASGLLALSEVRKIILERFQIIAFFILLIIINLIAFAWFTPIAAYYSPRLTYTLYLPYSFSMLVVVNKFSSLLPEKILGKVRVKPVYIQYAASLLITGLVLFDALMNVEGILSKGYFGK